VNFSFQKSIRSKIITMYRSLSLEQLNVIPTGFRNNLAWHLGHIAVTTDVLCYVRTGVNPEKEIPYLDQYKNGSVPEKWIAQQEIDYFLNKLLPAIEALEADYERGVFKEVQPYATMTFGVEMKDIETYFTCCVHHDILHFGHMQAMCKLV
jgi:hypothetical protein